MDKELQPIAWVAGLSLVFFAGLIFLQGNFEFLFYLGIVLALMWLIFKAHQKVQWPLYVLWHLLAWAILHLAGGTVRLTGKTLYATILIPLIGEPYNILKYDQVVHVYGFFVATLAIYYVLKPLLKKDHKSWFALGVVVTMAGLGLGALNEIVEFTATVITPSTGVGSYINNALDLVANFIGAIIAFFYLQKREK